jgi:hypothetical protein
LILGSAPNVVAARRWPGSLFDRIVAINNAWAVRDDWTDLIYPEDFPPDRRPFYIGPHQHFVTATDFVPAQNALGGFVYGGGTMAFTAGYWALMALRPTVIAYLGCDMIYPEAGHTHFYGTGAADPLRPDVTLRSLPAKSARLMVHAALQGCAIVNLSVDDSQLVFPRAGVNALSSQRPVTPDPDGLAEARSLEKQAAYMVPSGRYWEQKYRFDPLVIDRIDAAWLTALPKSIRLPRTSP